MITSKAKMDVFKTRNFPELHFFQIIAHNLKYVYITYFFPSMFITKNPNRNTKDIQNPFAKMIIIVSIFDFM